jgi:inorganic pyrophosphatase
MKDLVSLPVRSAEGVLVVVETPADSRVKPRLFLAPVHAAHGDAPKDVLSLAERLRSELEDFFVWSTRWEKKDLRFLGWGGIDEAEELLSAAERAARGGS